MTDPTTGTLVSPDYSRSFFGHPRGLATLFMTEFFERFTYYGLRTMLVLFLAASTTAQNPGYGVDNETAGAVYALFAGCAYLVTVPGGWIADQLVGQRNAVFTGGIFIAIGNFICAIPATPAVFYCGLAVTVLGIGLLKPNVSSVVGALYEGQPGSRRDAGFSIFYMGINLGAALGPIIAGGLGEDLNWRLGFGICGAAMLIGLVQFKMTEKYLGNAGHAPDIAPEQKRKTWMLVGLAAVLTLGGAAILFLGKETPSEKSLAHGLFIGEVALAVAFFGYVLLFGGLTTQEKKRVGVIIIFFLCAALFWAGFEQTGSSLNLFTDRYVDRAGVPASLFQSINPIYIILLGPVFAWLWTSLGRRGLEPSAPAKFGLGLVQLGAGFLVLVAGAYAAGVGNATPVLFIFLIYLLHTTGELCLSPVGLSAMNRLAPAHMASLIMGTWFFASATGNFTAGLIAAATGAEGLEGASAGKELVLSVYTTVGWIAVAVGVAVVVISPLIKRLMHLDTLRDAELAGYKEIGEKQAPGMFPQQETKPV